MEHPRSSSPIASSRPPPPLRNYVRCVLLVHICSLALVRPAWIDTRGSLHRWRLVLLSALRRRAHLGGGRARCDLQPATAAGALGAPVRAHVIGALQSVGAPAGSDRPKMIGAYLEPGATAALLQVPAVEFTDRVVSLDDVWGSRAARLAEDLADLDEPACIDRFEAALFAAAAVRAFQKIERRCDRTCALDAGGACVDVSAATRRGSRCIAPASDSRVSRSDRGEPQAILPAAALPCRTRLRGSRHGRAVGRSGGGAWVCGPVAHDRRVS